MARAKRDVSGMKKLAESDSVKRPRGRPGIKRSLVVGTADHNRALLAKVWPTVWPRLLRAENHEEVTAAFDGIDSYTRQRFVPYLSDVILAVIRHPKFPHSRAKSQINFLADSLAGGRRIGPRRSREICSEERNKVENKIVRRDYYIECTCGYEGPALKGACPNCGTKELSSELKGQEIARFLY